MKPVLHDLNVNHPGDGWESEALLKKRRAAARLRETWQDRETGYNEEWAAFAAETSRRKSRPGGISAEPEIRPRVWNQPSYR